MTDPINPDDLINVGQVFGDDNDDRSTVTYAEWTIVPGGDVNHAALVFRRGGMEFLGGSTGTEWGISLYQGHHYNGQTLPISEAAARHVLETLAGSRDLDGYDWAAQDWTYFE